MAHRSTNARLKYLDEAARLLVNNSPSTAAFLESEHNWIALQNDIVLPESRRNEVCSACGNILVLGSSMELLKQERKPSKRKRKANQLSIPSKTSEDIIYQCRRCYGETRISPKRTEKGKNSQTTLRKTIRIDADTAVAGTLSQDPKATPHPAASAESSNKTLPVVAPMVASIMADSVRSNSSTSKKRAKARKQGGLQAMLAKSKTESSASSGFGLDLMDFMKDD